MGKLVFSIAVFVVLASSGMTARANTITVGGISDAAFAGLTGAQITNAIFVRFENITNASNIRERSSILLMGSTLLGVGGIARRRLKRK